MNKADLIEVVSGKLGDRKAASTAIEAVVDAITRAVAKGEKVGISGFGVFEPVERAARTARNPTTGEAVRLEPTRVPKFRPGQGFKDIVSGAKEVDPTPGLRAVTARAGVPRKPKVAGEADPAAAPAAAPRSAKAAGRKAAAVTAAKGPATAAAAAKKTTRTAAPASTTRAAAPAAAKAPAKAKAAGGTAKATGRTVAAPGARSAAAAKAPGKKTPR